MDKLINVAQQVYGNGNRKKNSSSSIAIDKLSSKEEDEVLDYYSQLIDPDFRGWFVIRLRKIGKNKFVSLADRALKYGRNPQKMFSKLLQ